MKEQKLLPPLIRKLIYTIGVIWFLAIFIVAFTEPDLSHWQYLIVIAPLGIIFLFFGYAICYATFHIVIEWLAATNEPEEIKSAIKTNVILILIFLIVSQLLR